MYCIICAYNVYVSIVSVSNILYVSHTFLYLNILHCSVTKEASEVRHLSCFPKVTCLWDHTCTLGGVLCMLGCVLNIALGISCVVNNSLAQWDHSDSICVYILILWLPGLQLILDCEKTSVLYCMCDNVLCTDTYLYGPWDEVTDSARLDSQSSTMCLPACLSICSVVGESYVE